MEICCTFAGHRMVPNDIENNLYNAVCDLIENKATAIQIN